MRDDEIGHQVVRKFDGGVRDGNGKCFGFPTGGELVVGYWRGTSCGHDRDERGYASQNGTPRTAGHCCALLLGHCPAAPTSATDLRQFYRFVTFINTSKHLLAPSTRRDLRIQPERKLSRTLRFGLSRFRSTSTRLCQVPSDGSPATTGMVTEGLTRAGRTWSRP